MKDNLYKNDKWRIGYEILSYLAENPKSRDTLKGIIQWWLLEQNIKYQNTKVKEAVAELVKKGFILEQKGKDLQIHYKINHRKNNKIRKFLKQYSEVYNRVYI